MNSTRSNQDGRELDGLTVAGTQKSANILERNITKEDDLPAYPSPKEQPEEESDGSHAVEEQNEVLSPVQVWRPRIIHLALLLLFTG